MNKLTLAPIDNSPYEAIARATAWQAEFDQESLRYAEELDWLVAVDEAETAVSSLVGYSTEMPWDGDLMPSADLQEAQGRMWGPFGDKLLPFNDDSTAKGLGSKVTNSPDALRHRTIRDAVIARAVPFTSMGEVYRRDLDDADHGRLYLLARHGLLQARALATDAITASRRGTQNAIAHMERKYGDNPLVLMDTPPSWQIANERQHIEQQVKPQAMLVRGGRFAVQNTMRHIGTYQRPAKG